LNCIKNSLGQKCSLGNSLTHFAPSGCEPCSQTHRIFSQVWPVSEI
jgi:hypothetical protein